VGQAAAPATRQAPRSPAASTNAEPPVLTAKQRYEAANKAIGTKYGIAKAKAFQDSLKEKHGGAKSTDQENGGADRYGSRRL
jgi:hypothetical protein